jgi:hypothetical protein
VQKKKEEDYGTADMNGRIAVWEATRDHETA